MSRNNSTINDISERILDLSALYTSDREFLKTCNINNHTYITSLRKGKIQKPGSDYLQKIVHGTGCNAEWLLTGKGHMFQSRTEGVTDDEDAPLGLQADFNRALALIEKIESQPDVYKNIPVPPDAERKVLELLRWFQERRLNVSEGGGGVKADFFVAAK